MPVAPAPKRWLFRIAALAGTVVALELSAYVAHLVLYKAPFSYARIHDEQRAIAGVKDTYAGALAPPPLPFTARKEAVHPYLGYVWDSPGRRPIFDPDGFHTLGFAPQETRLRRERDPRHPQIAILGGSLAENFAGGEGGKALAAALGRSGRFSGTDVEIANLALAGYKQPQQLMALAYVIARGALFDAVVEIDGFNEIVLPQAENVPKGVAPDFPRSWYFRAGALDHDVRIAIGELSYLRERRRWWAQTFLDPPLSWSILGNLVWRRYDGRIQVELTAVERRLMAARNRPISFVKSGPFHPPGSDAALMDEMVRLWAQCSREMHALCVAQGTPYHHFLQPNQYVPGSKPMGPSEIDLAVRRGSLWERQVLAGYPLLQRSGAELARDGIAFHDATAVFASTPEPVYSDDCCHIDEHGSTLLAKAITAAIAGP